MKIGTLVARTEASTVRYRVTSTIGKGMFRILPYRHSGKELALVQISGMWVADGSQWIIVK